jgi:hypothetical protein
MEQRAKMKDVSDERCGIVMTGSSQMGRMKDEIERMSGTGVVVEKLIRMKGELTEDVVNKALRELAVIGEYPSAIVVGGPGNSLMEHGEGDWRGFGPERTVKVSKNTGGRTAEKWEVRYHMQEPRRISMVEKRQLVDRVVALIKGAGELFPESILAYMTTFPRHVERCCEKDSHMTMVDVVGLDSVRRDVDRDVIEMMVDSDKEFRVVEWWDLLGLDKDHSVSEVRKMRVIEGDGVHLSVRANRNAAVSLCRRVREMLNQEEKEDEVSVMGESKRRRVEKE